MLDELQVFLQPRHLLTHNVEDHFFDGYAQTLGHALSQAFGKDIGFEKRGDQPTYVYHDDDLQVTFLAYEMDYGHGAMLGIFQPAGNFAKFRKALEQVLTTGVVEYEKDIPRVALLQENTVVEKGEALLERLGVKLQEGCRVVRDEDLVALQYDNFWPTLAFPGQRS